MIVPAPPHLSLGLLDLSDVRLLEEPNAIRSNLSARVEAMYPKQPPQLTVEPMDVYELPVVNTTSQIDESNNVSQDDLEEVLLTQSAEMSKLRLQESLLAQQNEIAELRRQLGE